MDTGRMETFSDGVIAIIITIMVLELHVPHGAELKELAPLAPLFLSYVLSFIYLGIYWNNHHHLLRLVDNVDGPLLWANLHLLFWLSLFPVGSAWMGNTRVAPVPTALYGLILFLAAAAWLILQRAILHQQGPEGKLARALGSDLKGKASATLYAAGIGLSFIQPWIGFAIYAVVAALWLIPDRRFAAVAAASDGLA